MLLGIEQLRGFSCILDLVWMVSCGPGMHVCIPPGWTWQEMGSRGWQTSQKGRGAHGGKWLLLQVTSTAQLGDRRAVGTDEPIIQSSAIVPWRAGLRQERYMCLSQDFLVCIQVYPYSPFLVGCWLLGDGAESRHSELAVAPARCWGGGLAEISPCSLPLALPATAWGSAPASTRQAHWAVTERVPALIPRDPFRRWRLFAQP